MAGWIGSNTTAGRACSPDRARDRSGGEPPARHGWIEHGTRPAPLIRAMANEAGTRPAEYAPRSDRGSRPHPAHVPPIPLGGNEDAPTGVNAFRSPPRAAPRPARSAPARIRAKFRPRFGPHPGPRPPNSLAGNGGAPAGECLPLPPAGRAQASLQRACAEYAPRPARFEPYPGPCPADPWREAQTHRPERMPPVGPPRASISG